MAVEGIHFILLLSARQTRCSVCILPPSIPNVPNSSTQGESESDNLLLQRVNSSVVLPSPSLLKAWSSSDPLDRKLPVFEVRILLWYRPKFRSLCFHVCSWNLYVLAFMIPSLSMTSYFLFFPQSRPTVYIVVLAQKKMSLLRWRV